MTNNRHIKHNKNYKHEKCNEKGREHSKDTECYHYNEYIKGRLLKSEKRGKSEECYKYRGDERYNKSNERSKKKKRGIRKI